MSTRSSLRRSRRAPKKASDFNVGDLVEIPRGNSQLPGRLAQLLTEGSSPNPRWLVKFDGPYKDEEVYQHTFGKVLEAAVEDAASDDTPTDSAWPSQPRRTSSNKLPTSSVAPAKKTTATSGNINNNSTSSSPTSQASSGKAAVELPKESVDAAEVGTTEVSLTVDAPTAPAVTSEKKSVTFSNENSPAASEESSLAPEMGSGSAPKSGSTSGPAKSRSSSHAAKMSAREERSRRRQAIIDEFGVLPTGALMGTMSALPGISIPKPIISLPTASTGNTSTLVQVGTGNHHHTSTTSGNNNNNNQKRKLTSGHHPYMPSQSNHNNNGSKNTKSKKAKSDTEEECIKIKFLTGTLYLYRGRPRRAEFIRRI